MHPGESGSFAQDAEPSHSVERRPVPEALREELNRYERLYSHEDVVIVAHAAPPEPPWDRA